MKDRGLSVDSTIYNYTLVHKTMLPRTFPALYALLFAVSFGLVVAAYPQGLGAAAAAVPLTLLLHLIVTRLFLKFTADPSRNLWQVRWSYPWVGLLPVQHVAFRSFSRLHKHLWVIGFASIGFLYYGLHPAGLWMMSLTHVWLLFPRLWIMWDARKNKLKKSVLIKLNKTDGSFYLS